MSTLQDYAFKYILDNEGGWSNHALDKGGPTNLGVTLKTFRRAAAEHDELDFDLDDDGDVDAQDLARMDYPLALKVFDTYFWLPEFGSLASGRVAIKTADYGFNMGLSSGVKRLQMAVNSIISNALICDGKLGPRTLATVNCIPEPDLLSALSKEGIRFYRAIVTKDPEQKIWLRGWENRAMRLPGILLHN